MGGLKNGDYKKREEKKGQMGSEKGEKSLSSGRRKGFERAVREKNSWMRMGRRPVKLSRRPVKLSRRPVKLSRRPVKLSRRPVKLSRRPVKENDKPVKE